jgi:hypothetical protein
VFLPLVPDNAVTLIWKPNYVVREIRHEIKPIGFSDCSKWESIEDIRCQIDVPQLSE